MHSLKTLQNLRSTGEIEHVKAIYLTPYFDNPRGVTIPLERRAAIVALAQRWSHKQPLYVLADNAYRELRYDLEDVPSMLTVDREQCHVVEIGTFSKSFSPGLRVGWGILPSDLLEPVQSQKGNLDFGSPYFSQRVVAKVLELDQYDRHVSAIRRGYRTKREAMCAALQGRICDITWSDLGATARRTLRLVRTSRESVGRTQWAVTRSGTRGGNVLCTW